MRYLNDPIVVNQVMNTTINSIAIPLSNTYGYAIQATYTATPNGTLKLQASCDPFQEGNPLPPKPTNWSDLPNSIYTITAAGSVIYNQSNVMYNWVRLVYIDNSGGTSTAILNARIASKGV